MKEGSHKKTLKKYLYLSIKIQVNPGGQQEEGHGVVHHVQWEHHQSYLLHHVLHHYQNVSTCCKTCCTIIKMSASRADKFSAKRTKCRSPIVEQSSIVPYSIYKEYLNQTLGLTLSTLVLVDSWFVFEMRAFVIHGTRCPSLSVWNSFVVKLSYPAVVPFLSSSLLTLYCHGPRSGGLLLHWPGCCAIYWTKSKLTCIPSSSSCKMRTLCPNTTKCLA